MEEEHLSGTLRLKIIAFICGIAVMGLEMAGVRLLEPYLGSTIYVWGAIIGIFLGALALGYFMGGKVADRWPNTTALGIIIFLAALWIFAIPPAAIYVGKNLDLAISDPRMAAFLASLILYAVPSVLLGMVSPFAVRLCARELHKVGNVAGSLYAISTFGSIIGTFGVTFILTELVGTMAITWGVGAVLLIACGLCLKKKHGKSGVITAIIACAFCSVGWVGSKKADQARRIASVLSENDPRRKIEDGQNLQMVESAYHLINIIESNFNLDTRMFTTTGQKARYMVFNDQIESGCLTNLQGKVILPVETACGYVRLLNLGILLTEKKPENIAIIGCGGGVGPLMFKSKYQAKRIDVVDIDSKVFSMAGKYFAYPYPKTDGVIFSHVTDGRRFVAEAAQKWDYFVLDAYTAGGRIPKHLITKEFFELVNSKLTSDGVVVCNIISAVTGEKARLFKSVYLTMQQVFKHVYLFPRYTRYSETGNLMLVGSNHSGKQLTRQELAIRYNQLQQKLIRQPVSYVINNLPQYTPELAGGVVLTDNFCPTDSMIH